MSEVKNGGIKVNIGVISIIVLLILNLVAVAFGYGVTTQSVNYNRDMIQENREIQQNISNKLSDFMARLIRIETCVEEIQKGD